MSRASLIVALPLAICLLSVCLPTVAQNPDFTSGIAKIEQADYEGAIADLQRVRVGTRLYVGKIYELQGDTTQAIKVYQEEVTKSRGAAQADALVALGRLYNNAGLFVEAVEVLKQALDIEPNYVAALYEIGRAQMGRHQFEEAINTFDKASKILDEWSQFKREVQSLNPIQQRTRGKTNEMLAQKYAKTEEFANKLGLWPVLNKARGDAYAAAGKWAEARNAYRRALRRSENGDPADPDAHNRIAVAYLEDAKSLFRDEGLLMACIGVLQSATKSALEALSYDQDYAPAYHTLGLIYTFEANTYVSEPSRNIVSHSYQEAIEQFKKALSIDPNYFDAMVDMAIAYLDWAERLVPGSVDQTSAYSEAQRQLAKAASIKPRSGRVLAQMARLQLALENYDEALRLAQDALLVDKNDVSALNTAGLACYYQGKLGEAANYFTAAIQANDKLHQSYTNLANTFFQMQSWYRARREYRNALERIPDVQIANTAYQRAYILYLIGITYHETMMYDQEVDVLNKALVLDPSYIDALRQLGRAYEAKGDYRAAEQALRSALDAASDDLTEADIYAQLGQMYERQGNVHKAVGAYTAALNLDPNNLVARQTLESLQG